MEIVIEMGDEEKLLAPSTNRLIGCLLEMEAPAVAVTMGTSLAMCRHYLGDRCQQHRRIRINLVQDELHRLSRLLRDGYATSPVDVEALVYPWPTLVNMRGAAGTRGRSVAYKLNPSQVNEAKSRVGELRQLRTYLLQL